MSVHHYHRQISSEESHVSDVSIAELVKVAMSYSGPEDSWRIEDGAVVFSRPMGESLVGREEQS